MAKKSRKPVKVSPESQAWTVALTAEPPKHRLECPKCRRKVVAPFEKDRAIFCSKCLAKILRKLGAPEMIDRGLAKEAKTIKASWMPAMPKQTPRF